MRILHVLNHSQKLSGNVHAAVDLACAQSQLGHRVLFCSAGGDFDEILSKSGVGVVILEQKRTLRQLVSAVFGLRKLIRLEKIEVVHAHMMTSAVIARCAVFHLRIPLITTTHNAFSRASILMAVGSRVIAVSDAAKQVMIRRGVARSRIRAVLNGTIGSARLRNGVAASTSIEKGSIVYIGGLHPRKGVMDLLNAYEKVFRSVPAPKLYIVGDGPFLRQYESFARGLRSSTSIIFTGPTDSPLSILASAAIFVLPSHADPAPLVIAEAREAGCAIVATEVDGVPELLEGGRAGILVPPCDSEKLAAAIASLIADTDLLNTWRRNSQINIKYLSVDRVAKDTIEVYEDASANL